MNSEQAKLYTINDMTKTIRQWSEETGISKNLLKFRIQRGMSDQEILTTPKKRKTYASNR